MTNLEVATIIMKQIGISSMIGAKDYVILKNGLQFRWVAKAKNKSNCIQVTINGNDLYDVKFLYIRGVKCVTRSEHNNIYADMLISLFEQETGLFLHF